MSCDSCGIYFAKYNQIQERGEQSSASRVAHSEQSSATTFGLGKILLVSLVIGVVVAFVWPEDASESDDMSESVATIVESSGPAARLEQSHRPRNKIESARNATVFIETGWGSLGSGFIVSKDCQVVTNRHVVEMNVEKSVQVAQSDPKYVRQLAMEIIQKRSELQSNIYKYKAMVATHGETYESDVLKDEIDRQTEELSSIVENENSALLDKAEAIKEEGATEGIDVSLIDGTEFKIFDVTYSKKHDLALFKLQENGCPYLKLNANDNLEQGTPLYTIGNPSGLGYTVTSGIFSGYQVQEGKRLVQTDAPINPGNSGGPLITKDGSVVGVNSSILLDTEGIGFAIPAVVIKQEFGQAVAFEK